MQLGGMHLETSNPPALTILDYTQDSRVDRAKLARRIFDHAVSTKKLSYAFSEPVQSVKENSSVITVTTRTNHTWKARRVVCTVPLNVLADVEFSPQLHPLKTEASKVGHSHRGNKIHADIEGDDLISWSSFTYPGKGMIAGLADDLTPSGGHASRSIWADEACEHDRNLPCAQDGGYQGVGFTHSTYKEEHHTFGRFSNVLISSSVFSLTLLLSPCSMTLTNKL